MRLCDLDSGLGQLAQAFARLSQGRAAAAQQWDDATFRSFDQQHLQPIPARLELLIRAARTLQVAIAEAERELVDEASDESLGRNDIASHA